MALNFIGVTWKIFTISSDQLFPSLSASKRFYTILQCLKCLCSPLRYLRLSVSLQSCTKRKKYELDITWKVNLEQDVNTEIFYCNEK